MKDSIKAGELRCGNWVMYFDTPIKIDAINGDVKAPCSQSIYSTAEDTWCMLYAIRPIPLSKEVLEKCGFKKINHIHGYSFYSLDKLCIYETHTEYKGTTIAHCKYVHQLQNAAPVIWGKELEITL